MKNVENTSSCSTIVQGLRFAELFAGIGLVRKGFELSGWECIYANDIDPKKGEMYSLNFGADDFHCEDIWEIAKGDTIPRPVDLITASFPCTDLSLAGNRKGLSGKQSGTFWAFIEILEKLRGQGCQPPAIMIENVPGFLSSHQGKDFLAAINALNKNEYFTDAFLLDARHFTAQSRSRLFIVGLQKAYAEKVMTFQSNETFKSWDQILEHSKDTLRPLRLNKIIKQNDNCLWGLIDLPAPPVGKQRLNDVVDQMGANDPRWWDDMRLSKLLGQMSQLHTTILEEMRRSKTSKYGTVYRRIRQGGTRAELRVDGLAGCLRTPRGGSSKQIVVHACEGTVKARWMTPREYARLQGVDDTFRLPEKENQAYFGFGDAVCVHAIDWVARHAINPAFNFKSI